MTVKICLIVARSKNNVIGVGGDLPWHLRSDLQNFKKLTLGKPVIMGRKTWDSLPIKPLPKRLNVVISRNELLDIKGAVTATSLDEGIEIATEHAADDGASEVFIIGGAQVYAAAMPLVDRVYLTEVDTILDGDAHFDVDFSTGWRTVSRETFAPGEHDDHAFTITQYDRLGE